MRGRGSGVEVVEMVVAVTIRPVANECARRQEGSAIVNAPAVRRGALSLMRPSSGGERYH